jgi:hypothetical protein
MQVKSRGATFTVSQFLLILLIGAGLASAATSLYLSAHRTISFDSCRL